MEEKLVGEDKDTLEWLIFGYNQCAKMLNEKETMLDTITDNLVKSIDAINTKIKNQDFGENYINDHRKVRLKAIRTKCKELLRIIQGESNDSNV